LGDFGVQFDGEGSNELEVLVVGGGGEGEDSDVLEDSSDVLGSEGNVRVGVIIRSLLVGKSEGGESSSWVDGGSGDGVYFVGNSSSCWGQKRIDVSSDVVQSGGGVNLIVRFIGINRVVVRIDGNSGKVGIGIDSGKGSRGEGSS